MIGANNFELRDKNSIDDLVRNNFVSILESNISRFNNDKTAYREILNTDSTIGFNPRDRIRIEKITEESYLLTLSVSPFIVEKKGMFYAFQEAILESGLKLKDKKIKMINLPKIVNLPYLHPLVYPDGRLVYEYNPQLKTFGLKPNTWYHISHSNILRVAERYAASITGIGMILQMRNIKNNEKGHYLVRNFYNCHCNVASNRMDLKKYLLSNSINEQEIIKYK